MGDVSLCRAFKADVNFVYGITTVFFDTRLWKTKHPRKLFQNFRPSYVLSTDRIEIHQLQPLASPSDLLYVMPAGCDWLIHRRLTEILETFPRVCYFRKARINENAG